MGAFLKMELGYEQRVSGQPMLNKIETTNYQGPWYSNIFYNIYYLLFQLLLKNACVPPFTTQ